MTDKKQNATTQKSANRPTHSLCAKGVDAEIIYTHNIGGMWQKKASKGGTYGNVRINALYLRENPNKGANEPPFHLVVDTYIDGKAELAQIGTIAPKDNKGLFKVNHDELVLLPNRNGNKPTNGNQPQP